MSLRVLVPWQPWVQPHRAGSLQTPACELRGVGCPILPALRVLSASAAAPRLRRHESSLSLHQYFQYDTLQQKLRCLEEENQKLRMEVSGANWWDPPARVPMPPSLPGNPRSPWGSLEVLPVTLSPSNALAQATNITTETCQYEDQEQQLMIDCVEQFCTWGRAGGGGGSSSVGWGVCRGWGAVLWQWRNPGFSPAEASQQVVYLSDELARKAEDAARQQEEISQLLAQVADLQQKCRAVSVPPYAGDMLGGAGGAAA